MSCHARFLLTAALAAGVGGCAVTPPRVAMAPPSEMLVATTQADIVDVMVRLYPPAHTRLSLAEPARDALGQALVVALRGRGYAIEEPDVKSRRKAKEGPAGGLAFAYRVAAVHSDDIYELLVTVGKTRLSRVYALGNEGNVLVPAGDWARRE
jgi:hypothetical protein